MPGQDGAVPPTHSGTHKDTMAMPPLLHKAVRVIFKALLVFACSVLAALTVFVMLIMVGEVKHTSDLNRLLRQTKVPEQLVKPGVHPLASIFLGSEDRICVLEPYASGRGLDEMSARQLKATQDLDLPSEDGMWYLIAFQRDDVVRVLLSTIEQVELSSRPMCFFRDQSGVVEVRTHQREYLPLRSVQFHLKGE